MNDAVKDVRDAWMARVLGVRVGAAGGGRAGAGSLDQALGAWQSARQSVIVLLKSLAKDAADAKDPESAKAVMETQSVIKQLSTDPRTPQKVQELRRWLEQDDVVDDVCAMDSDIRVPLLKALASIERALA